MITRLSDLSPEAIAAYDAIIDARSPSEFAEDHIPGAINLPVLDDAERAAVGTIYKHVSPFEARRMGAALVSANIARHLQGPLSDKPKDWKPLIYCWRGGMRSGAMATVLAQVGWRVGVVDGGWKAWRAQVRENLGLKAPLIPMILIDGETGSAKTDIIRKLTDAGAQAIDLEDMAEHRGSVFGGLAGVSQPSQKMFETRLWKALSRLDLTTPVIAEAESAMIGGVRLPERLINSMRAAPRILIETSVKERARYLVTAYADIIDNPEMIDASITRLAAYHAKETIADWREMKERGDHEALAHALIETHYDPLYLRTRKRREGETLGTVKVATADAAGIDAATKDVLRLVRMN